MANSSQRNESQDSDMFDSESRGGSLEDVFNRIRKSREEDEDANQEKDDSEEDTLIRLSRLERRRRTSAMHADDEEDDEGFNQNDVDTEEEDDDDDIGNVEPTSFLRRLIESNARRNPGGESEDQDFDDDDDNTEGNNGEDDDDEDNELEDDDPRSQFLRAVGAISGGNSFSGRLGETDGARGFEDVVQRLMGGGVMFGGALGGGMRMNNTGEMDGLIENLNQREDTYFILETLNELSGRLLMMNGITAERLIPANKLAKSLVNIMEDPILAEELELHLVACRCLYNFIEVNQDFIHDALNNNAIEVLCNKLLEINYIDLTEQALQTLEMISRDPISHNQIIANDGLRACLQYLDFLTNHAQRKCLTIVSNVCTNISFTNFEKIKGVFENIAGVVSNHSDPLVVENGWLAISRIIISFKLKPELLNELFGDRPKILKELTEIIYLSCNKSSNTSANNDASKVALNYSSLLSLIKSLVILVSISVEVSKILLSECSIGDIIVKSLNKYSKDTASHKPDARENNSTTLNVESISIVALMSAPKELLSQFLILIAYLLPITYSSKDTPFLKDDHKDHKEKNEINQKRIELCTETIPDAYWEFVNKIWPLLINSFSASMDFEIRKKVFISIFRIVSFPSGSKKIQGVEIIASLLASVINQSKSTILKEHSLIDTEQSQKRTDSVDCDVEMLSSEEEEDGSKEEKTAKSKDSKDDDESEEEEEDSHGFISTNLEFRLSKQPPSSKIHPNILLLSSLLIAKSLIKSDPSTFIRDFEKEGLINDTSSILRCLEAKYSKAQLAELKPAASLPKISASYTNKYVDTEFTDEYEYKLTDEIVISQIVAAANGVKEIYDTSKVDGESNYVSKSVKILDEIRETLMDENARNDLEFKDWAELWTRLENVVSCKTSDGIETPISSFELMSSGIITALSHVFSDNNELGYEFSDCYKAFISVFFVDKSRIGENKTSSIAFLVNKLQEALTRSESFEIISSGGSNNGINANSNHENNQTAIMAKQVKLRLSAEDGPENLESKLPINMQNMILSIHAIATFKSVDTFLKQRFWFLEDSRGSDISREIGEGANDNSEDDSVGDHKSVNLEFLINGEVIPNEITIYGAVYRSLQNKTDEVIDPSKIWSSIHNVTFRKVSSSAAKESKLLCNNVVSVENELEIYDATTLNTLKLLKVLFEMNYFVKNNIDNSEAIPDSSFMNWKLTVKLNRQLEEPLVVASGTLPGWSIHVTKQFPFVFPLETRMFFLQSTSFGYSRLIHHWQVRTNQANEDSGNSNSSSQRPQLGRPTRHKVRLSRKSILQSAVKVLGLYGSTPGILEIEYFDEVGSGLGPTLEFYSTVSREFAKKKLRLWRDNDTTSKDEEKYIINECGLFPSPLDNSQVLEENGRKVLYFFASLGKFVARALLDSRIIDINFNPIFLKLVQYLNYEDKPSNLKKMANLPSLKQVDPKLAISIEHLLKYLKQYPQVKEEERDQIEVDGATIKDLSIYFNLPGYPDYELIPGGDDIQVDSSNLESYINKVLEATLYSGIIHQTKAFMEGFSKVFPINSLVLFTPQELVELFGNAEEDWSFETLSSAIHANHGYTKESAAIKSLVNILVSFSETDKRTFLQFLTGAPKLPIGGFKALRPELTVVRKHGENNLSDDDYLPSVMTCANYLKLPNYSSEELMREKLLQAIHDGAGAFLLS